jgi:hypothetical protein
VDFGFFVQKLDAAEEKFSEKNTIAEFPPKVIKTRNFKVYYTKTFHKTS